MHYLLSIHVLDLVHIIFCPLAFICLLLCGDFDINPGPDSVEDRIFSCESLFATSFETLVHLLV